MLKNPIVVAAIILAGSILVGLIYFDYNSPYNQCVRSVRSMRGNPAWTPEAACLQLQNPRPQPQ